MAAPDPSIRRAVVAALQLPRRWDAGQRVWLDRLVAPLPRELDPEAAPAVRALASVTGFDPLSELAAVMMAREQLPAHRAGVGIGGSAQQQTIAPRQASPARRYPSGQRARPAAMTNARSAAIAKQAVGRPQDAVARLESTANRVPLTESPAGTRNAARDDSTAATRESAEPIPDSRFALEAIDAPAPAGNTDRIRGLAARRRQRTRVRVESGDIQAPGPRAAQPDHAAARAPGHAPRAATTRWLDQVTSTLESASAGLTQGVEALPSRGDSNEAPSARAPHRGNTTAVSNDRGASAARLDIAELPSRAEPSPGATEAPATPSPSKPGALASDDLATALTDAADRHGVDLT